MLASIFDLPYRKLCCEAEKRPTLCAVPGPQLGGGDTPTLRVSGKREGESRDTQRKEEEKDVTETVIHEAAQEKHKAVCYKTKKKK